MVRWPAGLHPQGAKRNTSTLSWRPGFAGSGQQPASPVPIARYGRKISSVPLTGGQAQGVIGGFPVKSGSVTSPSLFQDIAGATTVPADGTYTVTWSVTLSGTVAAAEANNFILYGGPGGLDTLALSVNAAAAGTYPQASFTGRMRAGDTVGIVAGPSTPTSGAVYGGSYSGAAQPLSLQVGPQGLGTTWYPVSVTLSTTTGALDTSIAMVYLGPTATPATLQATVYSGNGTAALAIPSMSPGQTIIVAWSNGHPGDTAALNVTGSMDALSTG
jgi:hypothetical protein